MKLKHLRNSHRGATPVIGIILVVAITVILAAVIGTFVLGIGEKVRSSAPQTGMALSADVSENNITVEHIGGDAIPADEIEVTISNDTESVTLTPNGTEELTPGDTGAIKTSTPDVYWPGATGGTFSGTPFNLTDDYDAPYEVQIIHTESDQIFAERTVRP